MSNQNRNSRSPKKLKAKKKKSSAFLNLVAMFSGLVISLCGLLTLANTFLKGTEVEDSGNQASETTKEDEKDLLADSNGRKSGIDSLEVFLATATPDELSRKLVSLEQPKGITSLPVQVNHFRNRIRVADQLLMFDTEVGVRSLAIDAKLNGLASIFNLYLQAEVDQPAIDRELKDSAENYIFDSDPAVRRRARLALTGLQIIHLARGQAGADTPGQISAVFGKLLADFPDSVEMMRSLFLMLQSGLRINPDIGDDLTREILKDHATIEGEVAQRFIREIRDDIVLRELKYQQTVDRALSGTADQRRELTELLNRLAAMADGGERMINQVNIAANWLEQTNDISAARTAYQTLVDAAPDRHSREARDLATEFGSKGLVRCNLVGQKLEIRGRTISGDDVTTLLSSTPYIIVIFFNGSEWQALQELRRQLPSQTFSQFAFVVANIKPTGPPVQNDFTKQFPEFIFLDESGLSEDQPTLATQFPVSIFPRAIIVQANGTVLQTNISLTSLGTVLGQLRR